MPKRAFSAASHRRLARSPTCRSLVSIWVSCREICYRSTLMSRDLRAALHDGSNPRVLDAKCPNAFLWRGRIRRPQGVRAFRRDPGREGHQRHARSRQAHLNQKARWFHPQNLEDHYQTMLIDLIKQKRTGRSPTEGPPEGRERDRSDGRATQERWSGSRAGEDAKPTKKPKKASDD